MPAFAAGDIENIGVGIGNQGDVVKIDVGLNARNRVNDFRQLQLDGIGGRRRKQRLIWRRGGMTTAGKKSRAAGKSAKRKKIFHHPAPKGWREMADNV